MALLFNILRNGRDFSCSVSSENPFFVGRKVPYHENIGLYNIFSGSGLENLNFKPSNYVDDYGFWANFINPTAGCEGRNFLTLNSYDRASFTFGFGQFAAHVAEGDFVLYFREMLGRPEADDYFPSLALIDGTIHKVDGPGAPVQLEDARSTGALRQYLNPSLDDVEDQEVIAAAKLIHWTSRHREARLLQIKHMVATFRLSMREADRRKLIDGRTADICCVIADLLHHGRGGRMSWTLIASALQSDQPLENLLTIGVSDYAERVRTLRRLIAADPAMAARRWSSTEKDFI